MSTTTPTAQQLSVLAELADLHLDQGRLETAAAFHQTLRPHLQVLRSLPLSFLEPVVEPMAGLRWIEQGGRS
jgi:hypothetical protein